MQEPAINELIRHAKEYKVKQPSHYQGTFGLECIDAIRNALTPEEFRGYCKGNMIKYIFRERNKNQDEDLMKAKEYVELLFKEGYS